MPMNRSFIGREYPPKAFTVTVEDTTAFADAIGDPSPLFRDADAARAAGFDAPIAPPTFTTIHQVPASMAIAAIPELGLDWSTVLHGDQESEWIEPLLAGREYRAITRVADIRGRAPLEFIAIETRIEDERGRVVVRARSTLIAREENAG